VQDIEMTMKNDAGPHLSFSPFSPALLFHINKICSTHTHTFISEFSQVLSPKLPREEIASMQKKPDGVYVQKERAERRKMRRACWKTCCYGGKLIAS